MKLRKSSQWAREWFCEGSIPAQQTICKWVEAGDLPGMVLGDTVYVDEHQWLNDSSVRQRNPIFKEEKITHGTDLLD